MEKIRSANEKKIAESLIVERLPPKSFGLPVLPIFIDLAILLCRQLATSSISLGFQLLSKNGSSGLYSLRITNQPLPGKV